MLHNISIHGHAHTRVFTYTENGIHHEFTVPGGAALLQKLLCCESATLDGSYRCEYVELQRFEDKKSGKSYYAINRRTGISEGETSFASGNGASSALIWGCNTGNLPLPDGNRPILWTCGKYLPDYDQFNKIAANSFLFIGADVLRGAGALVSRQISWERTATELVWQLQNNPDISYLLKAPHILIAFAEDGAVYLRRENGELKASLVLTHGGGEGTLREKVQGEIDGAFILMTASLAQQFTAVMEGKQPLRILPILKTAEALMLSGYSIEGLQNSEYTIITETQEDENVFDIPLKPGQNAIDPDNWCIANNVSDKRVFDIAFNYVMEGAKEIEGLPQLSFGFFTTVDRWEIEAFQNIRNLIVAYAAGNSIKPLSIAVFGSPGSGKSFGVTQIAENVLLGKVKKLEFNVSQFTGFSDLGAAFQKVRDVILEGKLPLVFFDEFDSDRDGNILGWVKSFLMPMQDGKFKDDSGEHPLGKCILVFAGGTAANFEEFCIPMSLSGQQLNEQMRKALQEGVVEDINEYQNMEKLCSHFKSVKGPDFVSRLKGTINVLGPNQRDDNDKNYILRRALLLRGLCERKGLVKKGMAQISKNIIWAMLLVPQYKHGARSMEAILDMSRIEGNVWEPVSLPFYSQLALHVDADAFIKLVLREAILNSYNEELAKAIHEDYLKEMKAAGHENHPSYILWDELTEEYKESNRDQARNIVEKLNSVGYDYDAGDTPFPSIKEFDESTVLLLAQNEHLRWMNAAIANGRSFAPLAQGMEAAIAAHSPEEWAKFTDQEQEDKAVAELRKYKLSHLLVDWGELAEKEQQKDIKAVRNIITLLKSVGLRVYKTV